jgi:hypothetical protein
MALTPYGTGTPAPTADPPDIATYPAGSRYINPASGDYVYDSTTRQYGQMPTTRQRVLLAVKTLWGSSSALPTLGIRLPRKLGDTFVADIQQAVRSALYQLTNVEQVVRIDAIDVIKSQGGRAQATISYTDTTTGEASQVTT